MMEITMATSHPQLCSRSSTISSNLTQRFMTRTAISSFKSKTIMGKKGGVNGSPRRHQKQPSVVQIEKAIGIEPSSSSSSTPNSPVMEFLASTPIGKPESAGEKRLREAAEWVVDRIEDRALVSQKIFLVFCMKILPVWLFCLLVASGVIKLPFQLPFLDDLVA